MTDTSWQIPDPDTQPEFYHDVPVKRLVAWCADTIITLFLCVIILPFTAFTGLFFLPLLFLTVGFFYRLATVTQGSATLGMRLMSIEFITLRGERLDKTYAFWHCLGFTVSCVIPPLLVASGVMMLTTARGQGLTDVMLGTLAVNRRAAM
ncbi:RDD family protein [Roseovarius rhodophyticola]|uniref:RDD family protein n=1 Tax=Roseovarius rhodophyticola TaxID=3080827 RepID=A0ABZ2TDM7_9RHOB|nr:RDD family protein [Roseovarius sp. W115]MDV2928000.1 RDD family protein [Roseovarius sp. W115]